VSVSGLVATPLCTSTVARAAGPHWYSVCGKNGTATKSLAAPGKGAGGAEAQAPSRISKASAVMFRPTIVPALSWPVANLNKAESARASNLVKNVGYAKDFQYQEY